MHGLNVTPTSAYGKVRDCHLSSPNSSRCQARCTSSVHAWARDRGAKMHPPMHPPLLNSPFGGGPLRHGNVLGKAWHSLGMDCTAHRAKHNNAHQRTGKNLHLLNFLGLPKLISALILSIT